MNTTTTPASRFGWPGQTLEYVVTAKGAMHVSAPATSEDGLRVRVLETRPVADGVQARVAVEVASPVLF